MVGSKTRERIVIRISEKYGPFIRLSRPDDAAALEDALNDLHHVLYWKVEPESASSGVRRGGGSGAGSEYYFGNAADPVKLQAILAEIAF